MHFPYPPGEMARLFSGSRAKTIITYHSDIVRQKLLRSVYQPFLWRILRQADRIIATSGRYIDTSPYLSQFKGKCSIIPLGTDVAQFAQLKPETVADPRSMGVGTKHILRPDRGRLGLYFLETGANQRPSNVIYDREGSSVAIKPASDYDWSAIFEGAEWFVISGITPAISRNAADVTLVRSLCFAYGSRT